MLSILVKQSKFGWTKYDTDQNWLDQVRHRPNLVGPNMAPTKYWLDQIWVGPNMGPTKYAGPNNKNYIKIKF